MSFANFNWVRFFNTLRTSKRWWIPLAVLIALLTNAAGLLLPKKYESTAQVRIFEPQLKEMTGMTGGVLNIQDRLVTIHEEMMSDQFLGRVANKLNLDAGILPDSPEYHLLLDRMKRSLLLWVKGADLFVVSFQARTPEEARDVIEAIVNQYLADSSQFYDIRTKKSLSYIQTQLTQAQGDLDTTQRKVVDYKNAHINEIPEAQDANFVQLNTLRAAQTEDTQVRNSLGQALGLARQTRESTAKEVTQEVTTQESPDIQTLKSKRRELDLGLQMLLKDFTPEYWGVKEIQSQLKLIDEQLADAQLGQQQTVKTQRNPALQDLDNKITAMELDIKRLETRIGERAGIIKQLEAYNERVPERRLELDKLERERLNTQLQVDNLLKRHSEAKLTSELERVGQGPTFDVLDRPRLAPVPVSPNRMKILAVSLALAGGVAMALVFLLTLLDTAVRSLEEARLVLQMPVLGVVQRIVTATDERRHRRRRRLRWAGLGAGLALALIALAVCWTFYREPIVSGVERVRAMINERLAP